MNDVIINKIQSIQRCIQRAREEYQLAGEIFGTDYSRQDAAILNITRACELAIDLANHVIKQCKIGIPTSSAESFSLLAQKGIVPTDMAKKMIAMVGFRNIAVHEYQKIKIEIVEAIIKTGLDDLIGFVDAVLAYQKENKVD